MNDNNQEESKANLYPTVTSPMPTPAAEEPVVEKALSSSTPDSPAKAAHENGTQQQQNPQQPEPVHGHPSLEKPNPLPPTASDDHMTADHKSDDEKLGTHVMGTPAAPMSHPNNQKAAALWTADGAPIPTGKPSTSGSTGPVDAVLHKFNVWGAKAERSANNIWHNLKTGSSVSGSAWGKVNLTAKALSGGGFESLYKQTFSTFPNEKLKKRFACYLSTSTGPVAGTLYLSNIHVAFCSDRPLSFTSSSGQQSWSHYKVMVPLGNIGTINPVLMQEDLEEKYIQIVTTDAQDFWFMGFVNYDKATDHLFQGITSFAASGTPVFLTAPKKIQR